MGGLCSHGWTRTPPSVQGLAGSSQTRHGMRSYSLSELQQATNNFNELIGSGAFGEVFKGVLSDGRKIAVKRHRRWSPEALDDFHTEIELFSRLHHRNVVPLLGFYEEEPEMILVYEYMGQGTLASHLYGSHSDSCLSVKKRLEILIGIARALDYLHTGTEKGIIHRDVKSSNILLDDNFIPKICDFGLSRTGPESGRSDVTTDVKGTPGFLDPEYYRTWHVTLKSDVYSLGVVLLETLGGRKAFDQRFGPEKEELVKWAQKKLKDGGNLKDIVDQRIAGDIAEGSLTKYGKIVGKCLEETHDNRPSMADIIIGLEDVLRDLNIVVKPQPAEPELNILLSTYVITVFIISPSSLFEFVVSSLVPIYAFGCARALSL